MLGMCHTTPPQLMPTASSPMGASLAGVWQKDPAWARTQTLHHVSSCWSHARSRKFSQHLLAHIKNGAAVAAAASPCCPPWCNSTDESSLQLLSCDPAGNEWPETPYGDMIGTRQQWQCKSCGSRHNRAGEHCIACKGRKDKARWYLPKALTS